MTTVTRILLFATLFLSTFGAAAFAAPQTEVARILDMFAVREADVYIVHIIADGDISEFSSALEQRESTYKLTLDVPALPPLDTQYEVETPFSRRFQVWPMQLDKKLYSRVEIELDLEASSVVGVLDASHLFVRIQRDGADVISASEAEPMSTTAGAVTAEPIPQEPIAQEPPVTQEPVAEAIEPVPPTAIAELAPPTQEPPFSEDSDSETNDSGGEPLDSGGEPLDSGGEPLDSGGEPLDSGGEPLDSGGEPLDSGGEPLDSGGEPLDSGGEPLDSGGEPLDPDGEPLTPPRPRGHRARFERRRTFFQSLSQTRG